MTKITLENQLRALYDKAQKRSGRADPAEEPAARPADFGDTLKNSIERMNEISSKAAEGLDGVADAASLRAEIAEAGKMHRQIMEEQHNLAALYNKLNAPKKA